MPFAFSSSLVPIWYRSRLYQSDMWLKHCAPKRAQAYELCSEVSSNATTVEWEYEDY